MLTVLVELEHYTNHKIEEMLDMSWEWIDAVYFEYKKVKLRGQVEQAKYNAMAMRLDNDHVGFMERYIYIEEEEEDKKEKFSEDIRVIEALGGSWTKVPKYKEGK